MPPFILKRLRVLMYVFTPFSLVGTGVLMYYGNWSGAFTTLLGTTAAIVGIIVAHGSTALKHLTNPAVIRPILIVTAVCGYIVAAGGAYVRWVWGGPLSLLGLAALILGVAVVITSQLLLSDTSARDESLPKARGVGLVIFALVPSTLLSIALGLALMAEGATYWGSAMLFFGLAAGTLFVILLDRCNRREREPDQSNQYGS